MATITLGALDVITSFFKGEAESLTSLLERARDRQYGTCPPVLSGSPKDSVSSNMQVVKKAEPHIEAGENCSQIALRQKLGSRWFCLFLLHNVREQGEITTGST